MQNKPITEFLFLPASFPFHFSKAELIKKKTECLGLSQKKIICLERAKHSMSTHSLLFVCN